MTARRILLVDDDPLVLRSLGTVLQDAGYALTPARGGEEALDLLSGAPFDLIITDLVMPGLDGLGFLKAARKVNPDVKVIVLTGYGNMASAIDALRLHADDFLIKPCEPEEILFRVSKCFGAIEAERRAKRVQAALESDRRYREIASHASQGIAVVRGSGTGPVFTNPALSEMLGYDPEEFSSLSCQEAAQFVHPDDRNGFLENVLDLLRGRVIQTRNELRALKKDGLMMWLAVTCGRTVFQGRRSIQIVCEDITAVKDAEGFLKRAHLELERRVAARTKALKAANTRLGTEISKRTEAEKNLLAAQGDLERKVRERTEEISAINRQLKQEIRARKRTEKELLAFQQQLRSLSSQLFLSEETERRRIAQGLHDRVGQALAMSKIALISLSEEAPNPDISRNLREVSQAVGNAIEEIRTLMFELSPPILYELGLEAAIEWYVESFQEKHRIPVSFSSDDNGVDLDHDTSVALFQATRELLFNVVKHAGASRVSVSLLTNGDGIRVEVEDDGNGFHPDASGTPDGTLGGFGLFSIRERLRHLGGALEIISSPGRGTRAVLRSNPETVSRNRVRRSAP